MQWKGAVVSCELFWCCSMEPQRHREHQVYQRFSSCCFVSFVSLWFKKRENKNPEAASGFSSGYILSGLNTFSSTGGLTSTLVMVSSPNGRPMLMGTTMPSGSFL